MSLISDVTRSLGALDQSPAPLRKSAFTVGAALLLLGAVFAVRGRHPWLRDLLGAAGLVLVAAGALVPAHLRRPHRIWMALALTIGWVMSRAVLVLLFALVLTPLALLARLSGKRFLELRRDPGAASYWVPRPPDEVPRYDKMY